MGIYAVGVVLLGLSVMGICAARRQSRRLLRNYIASLVLCVVSLLVFGLSYAMLDPDEVDLWIARLSPTYQRSAADMTHLLHKAYEHRLVATSIGLLVMFALFVNIFMAIAF